MATPTTPPPTPAAAKKKTPAAAPPLSKGPTAEQYARQAYAWLKANDPVYLVGLIQQGKAAEHLTGAARHARELLEHHQRQGAPQAAAEEAAQAAIVKPDFDPPEPANPARTAAAIEKWEETDEAKPFVAPRAAAAPKK